MELLISMLPFYLLGNLHCLGMCGPLVLMLGRHQYKYWYFFGRTISFSLAGIFAGEIGLILQIFLRKYHVSAMTCFIFGGGIFFIGLLNLYGGKIPLSRVLALAVAPLQKNLTVHLLQDKPLSTFLFGFFTIFLPCGQLIIVYSVCALSADPSVGFINGLCFAILTSPSLILILQAEQYLNRIRKHYNKIMGILALTIGTIAIFRGLADLELINHLVLNEKLHLIVY